MEQQVIEAVREAARQVKYNVGDGTPRTKAYAALLEAILWLEHGQALERSID